MVFAVKVASKPSLPATETISGVVHRTTFRNDETGFSILRVTIKGRPDPVTVVGCTEAREGETISASGKWEHHPSFGMQLKAERIVASVPASRDGIISYLSSGLIKGIGATYAKRIVDAFGEGTLEVMEKEPDRLLEVQGIGATRLQKIKDGWVEQRAVKEIMVFLHSNGVPSGQAFRIYKTYGDKSIDVIRKNPYQLARDVRGIGFSNADKIAANLGIPRDSMQRVRAGLAHVLSEASGRGHCGLAQQDLLTGAVETLGVTHDLVRQGIAEELGDARPQIVKHGDVVFVERLAWHEEQIAKRLKSMVKGVSPWRVPDTAAMIDWVEKENGYPLAEHQAEAVALALKSKISIITGGPGTGKSTILDSILKILRRMKVEIALAAPTGKAAKRMNEATGMEAKTIHRLIGLKGHGGDGDTQVACDLLVIDESSMLDVPLMAATLRAVPDSAAILFVGDIDQLPSVGPGQVIADMIRSGAIPVARLTKIFRQAEGSLIIQSAHRVNRGDMPERGEKGGDFFFIEEEDPERLVERVKNIVTERIPAAFGLDPKKDVQVLCPMRQSNTGTVAMNRMLQQLVNPSPAVSTEQMGIRFGVGDKVMQTANDYDKLVFNGDTGLVSGIDIEDKKLSVVFDGRAVEYDFTELYQLVLSYAMTIHKSQGSQFPAVIIPITTQHFMMLQRNLLYTAITRASKLCVVIGQSKAVAMAVKNDKALDRVTRLHELLRNG